MTATRGDQKLGLWMTTALVVGGMIGSGVFFLPVSLAPLGRNAVYAWLVSGFGAIALAFALGRLARCEGGEGLQYYVEQAFGPTIGFIVTWALWVGFWTANAAIAIAAAAAVSRLVPALSGDGPIGWTAIAMVCALLVSNAMGARTTGRLAIATVAIKLLPLLAVVAIVAARLASEHALEPLAPLPVNFDNLATATALTLFALTGFEIAISTVNKVRDPNRTIPRALSSGTAFVALLYLLCCTSVLLLLPLGAAQSSVVPFADAIATEWGEAGALFAAFGMAVSAFGTLNGGVLGAGELGYSMALRGDLPRWLAATRRGNTPVNAQLLGGALTILLILANSSRATAGLFTFLILVSTSATLWVYLAGALAALRQRPGHFALALILVGIAFIAFAFYGSGMEANLWSLALLGAGLVLYMVRLTLGRRSTPARADSPVAPPGSAS